MLKPPSRIAGGYTPRSVADPAPLRIVRLAPGWWIDLAGTTVLSTPSPGHAADVGDADLVLGSGREPPPG
jgi:hypothetical protein